MAGRIRMLQSPGVEITEIDKSQIAPSISGTYVLIPGFADRGEDYEVVTGNSIDQFIAYYGQPTNEAERYFYYAVKDVVEEGATAVTIKLPYENDLCNNYKALKLTLADDPSALNVGSLPSNVTFSNALSAMSESLSTNTPGNIFYNGSFDSYRELSAVPTMIDTNAYDILQQAGGLIDVPEIRDEHDGSLSTIEDLGADWDLLLVDISKSILSFNNIDRDQDRTCGGLFIAIVDYASAAYVQRLTTLNKDKPDADVMDMVRYIEFPFKTSRMQYIEGSSGAGSTQEVPPSYVSYTINGNKVGVKLSDAFMYTSLSEDLMRKFPNIDIVDLNRNTDSATVKQMASVEYLNYVTIVVGRMKVDMTTNAGAIIPEIIETFFGSLDENSKDPHTGQSDFICNVVNATSTNIRLFDNRTKTVFDPATNATSTNIRLFDNRTKTVFDPATPLIAQKRINTITYGEKLKGVADGKLAFPFYNSSMVEVTNNANGETNAIDGKMKLIGFDPNYDVAKLLSTEKILTGLDRAFSKVGNIDEIQIDIVLDAGISNIAEFVADSSGQY